LVATIINEILYLGHLQSLGTGVVAFIANNQFNGGSSVAIFLFTYCTYQIVYYQDRLLGVVSDKPSNAKRSLHIKKCSKTYPFVLLLYAIFVLVSILILNKPSLVLLAVAIIILGVLYTSFFKGITSRVLMFKNIYVSLVYAFSVVIPVLITRNATVLSGVGALLVFYVFLEAMISQILLDIKDVDTDIKSNLKTLPALIGSEKTLQLARYLSVLTFLIFIMLSVAMDAYILLTIIIISFVANLISIYYIKKSKTTGYLFSAGKFTFWFLAILVNSIFI
jgi:4-hydroxybenzoate polyprenyltransferase